MKAAEVNEAIYCSEWYSYPPKIQMFTILIMKRAQKPFILRGYSLVSCSLQSFKEVIHEFLSPCISIANKFLTFQMLNFVASVFILLLKFSK